MLLLSYVFRSMVARFRANVVTILSVALFVAGGSVGLSYYFDLKQELVDTSAPDTIIVLGKGAAAEGGSRLNLETARKVAVLEGIKQEEGAPLVALELVSAVAVNETEFSSYQGTVPIRGIDKQSLKVHRVKLVEGTPPEDGSMQAIVGVALLRENPNLRVGSDLALPGGPAKITGVFSTGGGPLEGEVWTPRTALELHMKSKNLSSMTIVASDVGRVPELVAKINNTKDVEATAISMKEFRAAGAGLAAVVRVVLAVLILLSVVAASAIAATMSAAILVRMPEQAALVAIGIRRGLLGRLVVMESVLLTLVGAAIGVGASFLLRGVLAKIGFASGVAASPHAIVPIVGLGLGLLIGVIGGLAPAMSVHRLDVIKALRG